MRSTRRFGSVAPNSRLELTVAGGPDGSRSEESLKGAGKRSCVSWRSGLVVKPTVTAGMVNSKDWGARTGPDWARPGEARCTP